MSRRKASLREGTRRDDDGLRQRIMLQRFPSVFLAEAALLPSAEGQLVKHDLGGIDPGVAGLQFFRRVVGLVEIARVNRGAEAVDGVIRPLHCLLDVLYPEDRKRRTKAL